MRKAVAAVALALAVLAGCARQEPPPVAALPPVAGNAAAAPRLSGGVGTPGALPPPQVLYGTGGPAGTPGRAAGPGGLGQFSLDFADTDIREAVGQILGGMLGMNFAIDPAVHGTVTLRTVHPISRAELIPTLETLLAQNGAVLVQSDGLYRVVPAAAAPAAGARVLALRYASADALAKLLQPLAGNGAKVLADPVQNLLLVSGDPGQIAAVAEMVAAFDTDALAGQSYALLPVAAGTARDLADALQEAMHARGEAGLGGLVRVLPLTRMNAVLIVSAQSRYIEAARRVYAMVERSRRQTVRSWQVYYLQDSDADDVAYLLQQAFTPNNVTAQPSSVTHPRQGIGQGTSLSLGQNAATGIGGGVGGVSGGGITGGAGTGAPGQPGQAGGAVPFPPPAAAGAAAPAAAGNPLLGGLEQQGGGTEAEAMRILPDSQNNSVLIYATPQEAETVLAMLRKIDILPLQVRIDAVIVEVTLNDALQYGTQFFFKGNGLNVLLNNATATAAAIGSTTNPAAFVISGQGAGGAPAALSLLQAVTTIHVLSSPELVVLDNQPARLQVGDLVPYLTSTSQSTIANSAVINSVNYQPTGVILQVTPRVNSGGLVTLDLEQEVSNIDTTITSAQTGINSPAFLERDVTSRVVVQDGQTVGIAGLIQDSVTRGNQGIPWFKDIPLLGSLFSTQNNSRARTELLVLITPHVMRDQHEARALTEDMREALPNAAAVPAELQHLPLSGSADPNQRLRDKLRNQLELGDPPAPSQ